VSGVSDGDMKAGAAVVVGLVVILLALAGFSPRPIALILCTLAVVVVASAAALAVRIADRRAKSARAEVEAELSAFQAIMGDLPELALAMDLQGRAQAVFGQAVPGLDPQSLHEGLLHAVAEIDRPRVQAALDEAAATGRAEVVFMPASLDAPRLSAAFQRTGAGGLTAILREAPVIPSPAPGAASRLNGAAAPAPIPASIEDAAPWADLVRRVKEAETARDAAEASRKRAEADATGRARFLANMSHELRTPLNAIMGFSDIMRSRMFGDLGPRYTDYAELIHESGRHLLDVINDVLDMSKIEAQRFDLTREVFDARDAVNAALRLVRLQADEAGVKLRGVLPSESLRIDADRRAIKQIVLNLVSNALKFTPAGGSVTVSVERAAGEFELLVADTGVGIAPEDLDRLGRPYEQAGDANERAQGTGLGLSLVRSFAELHGGRMTLESRLGEGTAVAVRLPVLVGEAAVVEHVRSPALASEPSSTPPTALIKTASTSTPSTTPRWPKVAPGGAPDAP